MVSWIESRSRQFLRGQSTSEVETKVAFNTTYGPFTLSEEAISRYQDLSKSFFRAETISRHDPFLIKVLEELGSVRASQSPMLLAVATIPAFSAYHIESYDGLEAVFIIQSDGKGTRAPHSFLQLGLAS